ncbi:MAG: nicotinate (nicotinamide) nucleotide adenylyltransferase [Flavobacteriales bacterium]
MRIGLFFGTFNPIHVGHLIIANYMAQHPDLDQVWLVVTPQNPLKAKESLLADHIRLDMSREAVMDYPRLNVSDLEFQLPKPNYTISTLTHFCEKYPQHTFSLLLGEDNLRNFHKWFNWEQILAKHCLYVYPRALTPGELSNEQPRAEHPNIIMVPDVPVLGVSSSKIRALLADKKDCSFLLTDKVLRYIEERGLYQ